MHPHSIFPHGNFRGAADHARRDDQQELRRLHCKSQVKRHAPGAWLARALGALIVASVGTGCDRSAEHSPAPRGTTATTATASAPNTSALSSVVVLTGNAQASQRLPLVVALHGLGDRPESFATLFDGISWQARIVLLRAPLPFGDGYSWFPYRPGQSDEERARVLQAPAALVAKEIGAMETRYPTQGRPMVTGFSQGGMLAFAIASQHPTRVGAAFPVGGLLPRPLLPKNSAAAPLVVALHGANDTRVPTADGEHSVSELKSVGYDARFEAFPEVGHSISPAMRQRLHALIHEQIQRAR